MDSKRQPGYRRVVRVDGVEAQTKLNFMAELPDEEEERIEMQKAAVW